MKEIGEGIGTGLFCIAVSILLSMGMVSCSLNESNITSAEFCMDYEYDVCMERMKAYRKQVKQEQGFKE